MFLCVSAVWLLLHFGSHLQYYWGIVLMSVFHFLLLTVKITLNYSKLLFLKWQLKGQSTNFICQSQFSHWESYSTIENSCVMYSVALVELCQVGENDPSDITQVSRLGLKATHVLHYKLAANSLKEMDVYQAGWVRWPIKLNYGKCSIQCFWSLTHSIGPSLNFYRFYCFLAL